MIRSTNNKRSDENKTDGLSKNVKKSVTTEEGHNGNDVLKRNVLRVLNNRQTISGTVANKDGAQKALKPNTVAAAILKTARQSNNAREGENGTTKMDVKEQQTTNAQKTLTTKMVEQKIERLKITKVDSFEEAFGGIKSSVTERSIAAADSSSTNNTARTNHPNTQSFVTEAIKFNNARQNTKNQNLRRNSNNHLANSRNTFPDLPRSSSLHDEKSSNRMDIAELTKKCGYIRDIDAGDENNLMLVSEYSNDIHSYLFRLEACQLVRRDYMSEHTEINSKMRTILLDWLNEVHYQFHLLNEVFQMAVGMIDRYLQSVPTVKRSELQLVGVTALFLAAKYEEVYPPPISDFVYITDDTYTSAQIRKMEIDMFQKLDFNFSRPIPLQFLRRFSKAANAFEAQHVMAKYFIELALIEYDLCSYKPSEIAAGCLYLAMNLLCKETHQCIGRLNTSLWTPTLQWYSRYHSFNLTPIARKVATVALNAPQSKSKAVYTKYTSSKSLKISLHQNLYGAYMRSLAYPRID